MLPLVTDVERIVIQVPFRERVALWNSLLVNNFQVIEIVRVITEDPAVVGYGETMVHYTHASVTDESVSRVVGGTLSAHISDDTIGAGLQMALYDAIGKATGAPVYQLLGQQVRDWCPISWWNTKAPPEVLAAEAKDALAAGYLSHKIKARPWFDVYEQIDAIAEVTPIDYAIDIDWNAMLRDSARALPVLDRLRDQERIGLYEDPIPREDVIGQQVLRERAGRAIVTHVNDSLLPIQIRDNAVDGYVVDGGVHRALRTGAVLAAFNKSFFLQHCGTGITTAMSLHVASVLTHAHWPAVNIMNTFAETLLSTPLEIKGGFARVPDGPGLGIQVDEAAIDRLRMAQPHVLELPRRINTLVLSGGRTRHYASLPQLWIDYERNGSIPVQSRGARLEVRDDDGSADFDDLHRRVLEFPVWDVRDNA